MQTPLSSTVTTMPHAQFKTLGIKEQAAQCFNHIKAIVESIDHKMADVVKVNVFLKNIADIPAFDEVYSTFFKDGIPARRIVGVSALPKDALIQMDVVLGNEEGTPPKA